jgi:hypothetical protein
MTVKLLLEESRSLCVLFLVLAFSINLNLPSTNNRVMHAAGVQQLLEQGRSITRDIADGEVHSFSFDVKVGEFLHVFVRQLGVNVAVRLIAPEGTRVIEADIPRSTEEPEWLVSVARVAGRYSVEVRTVDRGAVAGKYEIKLDELRQQTANDDSLLAAQTAFSDGSRMFNEKNYKGAIQKY